MADIVTQLGLEVGDMTRCIVFDENSMKNGTSSLLVCVASLDACVSHILLSLFALLLL